MSNQHPVELPCDSAECFRLLMSNIEDYVILLTNRELTIVDWNPGIRNILGYERDEIMGRNADIIFTDADKAVGIPQQEVNRALIEGKSEDNRWQLRKDGSLFFASGVMTCLKDSTGEVRGFLKLIRDRTANREYLNALERDRDVAVKGLRVATQEVLRGDRLLQAVTEATPVNISVFDLQSQRSVYTNRPDGELLGYEPNQLPTDPEQRIATMLHPEDISRYYQALQDARSMADGDVVELECRFLHASGNWRWLYNHFAVFSRDESGKPCQLIGITMDVTERRESEERVRQLNEDLEQRVASRTEEIQAANRELEAFSYSIAHDLRAPLRAINTFSRFALDEKDNNPMKLDEYLQKIHDQSNRMEKMLQGLLAFSKATRQPVLRQILDMRQFVDEALDTLRPDIIERNVEIVVNDLPSCHGDPTLVKQVWVNLISNAIKYTSKTVIAKVTIGAQTGSDAPVYYVSDNGAGFDMRRAHKLFGVFQRLHPESEFEGTGVGLAIVHRILNRHGGSIWAESELGKGTTMFFSFPCILPDPEP